MAYIKKKIPLPKSGGELQSVLGTIFNASRLLVWNFV